MNTHAVQAIWDLAVEFAFDCRLTGANWPNRKDNPIHQHLMQAVDTLAGRIRLMMTSSQAKFESATLLLEEADRQLEVARCLGFIEETVFRRLHSQAAALAQLIGVSR